MRHFQSYKGGKQMKCIICNTSAISYTYSRSQNKKRTMNEYLGLDYKYAKAIKDRTHFKLKEVCEKQQYRYNIKLNSLEDIFLIKDVLEHEIIIREDKRQMAVIEIYDDWRE